jgi:hypothetical protein
MNHRLKMHFKLTDKQSVFLTNLTIIFLLFAEESAVACTLLL